MPSIKNPKVNTVNSKFQVLAAIKGHADGAVLRQYLKAGFSLSKGEFPHKMCF